jgi:hypothetical protein
MFPMPFVFIERPGAEPLYVSLQSRWTPFGRLPEQFQGGRAFIVDGDQTRIELLPPARPEESAFSVTATLRLGTDRDARADVTVTSRGVMFHAIKDQLKTLPAFQKDLVLRQMATQFFPGAKVEKADILGLEGFESPSLTVQLTAPKFLRTSNQSYLLKPVFHPARLVKQFSERSVRQHPFHMRGQQAFRDVIRIEPGESYTLERLPSGVTIANALGNFTLTYRTDGPAVVVERELTLLSGRLSAGDYGEFIEFCEKVDGAEEESIAFRKS